MPRFGRISNIKKQRFQGVEYYKLATPSVAHRYTNKEWLGLHNPLGNPSIKSKSCTDIAWLIWCMRKVFPKDMTLKILFSGGLVEWMFVCCSTIEPTAFVCRLLSCYSEKNCTHRDGQKCKYCRYKSIYDKVQN